MSPSVRCLVLLLCCLFLSRIAFSQLQKIYLHPKAAGSEKQAKFIDSLRFIPLEIKDGIEVKQYSAVQVTRDYFLIVDYLGKAAQFYSKDGRFVRKVNYKHLGDAFYPQYNERTDELVFFGNNKNYTLTRRDRIKIKLNWSNPRNKKYFKKYTIDLSDTSFTIKKTMPEQNDIIHASPLYDDVTSMIDISTSDLYKDSLDYEFKLYKGSRLEKGFFPYNQINEPRFLYKEEYISVNKTDDASVHFITRPYCDTVYKMTGSELVPAYQIVLPLENSLPPSFFTQPFKNKTDRENFDRNNGWVFHQVYSFYETPWFIYFSMGYLSNYESYIYQKQTQTTWKAKNIKADSSQYNLTLFSDFGISRKLDRFYKTVKAGDLLTFFDKHKETPVPKELQFFLQSHPPAASPVIVEFTFKN